jgi:peptidoglycan/LPS O-acetylase OafA/YrhL
MTAPQSESYRPEIDGLRAVAVLPVIFYHLSATLVPAGFLGVDVFFVISGYLITGLLVADLQNGRFSLWRFYERRARRILPALFLVIAACVLPAAALMLPGQHADFGLAVLAAVGFMSNVLYYGSTGYFMPSAEIMPLLHTWSLAVEEQFYLFFPLILYAAWRFGRRSLPVVVVLFGLASVGFGLWLARSDPAANFYLLPARAWELMAGALVVLWRRPPGILAEIFAAGGLAMIVIAYALPDGGSPLPGLPAVLPVVGAALLLWSSSASGAGRLLSAAPLRWIGRISYSAYLWHWPIIAFWRLRGGGEMTVASGLLIVLATLALATLTFAFVEQPFRNRGPAGPFPTRALVPFLAVNTAALVMVGLLPVLSSTIGARSLASDAASIEARLTTNYGLGIACEGSFTLDPSCRTSERPEVLLWGDSYAMHLAPAILSAGDWGGMIQMTKSSCAPVLGLSMAPTEYATDWYIGCLRFNDEVFAWLAGARSVRIVVLSSNLNILFNSLRRPDGSVIPESQAMAAVGAALLDTAERIRALGKEVVIISPTPATGTDIGQCLAAAELSGGTLAACDFALVDSGNTNRMAIEFLRDLSAQIPVIDLTTLICPNGQCSTRQGDVFVYRDQGHLSVEGAEWLGRTYRFDRLIRQSTAQSVVAIN